MLRVSKTGKIVGWTCLVFVLGGIAGWAVRATLTPSSSIQEQLPQFTAVTVREQSVGRTLPLSVTVVQSANPVATNTLTGIVTYVNPGRRHQGETIYTVGAVEVHVLQGDVPFFRDLGRGLNGADVRQLQTGLVTLGYPTRTDGYYGVDTERAVMAWRKASMQSPSRSIALGELIAVPRLPVNLRLGKEIVRSALLSGGEISVLAVGDEPTFSLIVSGEQAALIPADAKVLVHFKTFAWDATVASTDLESGTGNTVLRLTAPGGGRVCGRDCASLPSEPSLSLRADVMVTPKVTGPAAPAAAVLTDADGSPYVVMSDGARREVGIIAAGSGMVIVHGVAAGDKVQVAVAGEKGSLSGEAPPSASR